MTVHINVCEAATHLPELARQALAGEEVVIDIDADGTEQVKLVPLKIRQTSVRIPGIDEGRLVVPDDFNDPLPEDILRAFEGG